MKARYQRIKALIKKELLSLLKDPKGRLVLIGPPLLQLLIFSFAATLEVKNISVVVLNKDMGKHSIEILQRLHGAPYFTKILFTKNFTDFKNCIEEQNAIVGISFQKNFSRKIEANNTANVQIIVDGRRSNAAQIVSAYISELISIYATELQNTSNQFFRIIPRNWFNSNLLYLWFTVPSLVCMLSMIIALVVTSLSVARERELGTFDQILVSPLMPYEILIGKTVPAVIVSFLEGLFIWLMGVTFFGVPFSGSFILLILSIFIFILSIVGVGLMISAVSKTQQQAVLGTFIFMVPTTTLSGYASPIDNMPQLFQVFSYANPLKYALILMKGLFLKDMKFHEVFSNIWPLLIISCVTLAIAGWFFSKRLE